MIETWVCPTCTGRVRPVTPEELERADIVRCCARCFITIVPRRAKTPWDRCHGRYILADDSHTPVECPDLFEWAEWFETKRIDTFLSTDVSPGVRVSTGFMGIDQEVLGGFREEPAPGFYVPLIWETMAFGGPLDLEQDRYRSWEEAKAGHEAMVERVKAALMEGAGETKH